LTRTLWNLPGRRDPRLLPRLLALSLHQAGPLRLHDVPGIAGRLEPGLVLDEGDVAPGAGPQGHGVVVGVPAQAEGPVLGDHVPFLAGDLAGLAADAHRGVGEEPHP